MIDPQYNEIELIRKDWEASNHPFENANARLLGAILPCLAPNFHQPLWDLVRHLKEEYDHHPNKNGFYYNGSQLAGAIGRIGRWGEPGVPELSTAYDIVISIGWNKNGEPDFEVSGRVSGLTLEEMNELRAMIPVAIGTAEQMFRDSQSVKQIVNAAGS